MGQYSVLIGCLITLASTLSFSTSLRIFCVILQSRCRRNSKTFQIYAVIAFMECVQMSTGMASGLLIAIQKPVDDVLNTVFLTVILYVLKILFRRLNQLE
ncbi:hypothetical protein L596_013681 [Steinernema carpocapsae]|uniref:7TM GPCR serpentine receptor class x (Srx) domain-containing protein n=1 Tax=Steinernema carpocapsae TaxID=34508 RepID=A0A4U5P0X3_STECR|nr:hypothetical protein L596_013681 [Steinernema carpocapsae]